MSCRPKIQMTKKYSIVVKIFGTVLKQNWHVTYCYRLLGRKVKLKDALGFFNIPSELFIH